MSRWQIAWWWRPSEWEWGFAGTFSDWPLGSGSYRSWQFGPLEIRKWEASS